MTQADFSDADLVTFEEMAALARLTATTPPDYAAFAGPDLFEAAVAVGIRSLLARKWVTVAVDRSGVQLADGLGALVRALGEASSFVMLARSATGAGDRRGRIVVIDEGRAVVEEVVYPGLVSLTALDAARVADFVVAVFGLDADEVGDPRVDEPPRQVVARAPDGSRPVDAEGWIKPALNVVLVSGPDHAGGLQWVDEGDDARRLWLLDPGEGYAVEGIPATQVSLTQVRDRLAHALVALTSGP